MADKYRNVSAHAQPLASGRPVAPGELCELDLDNPHDQALVTDGHMAQAETKRTPKKEA